MNTEPTEAEVKKFWEGIGFRFHVYKLGKGFERSGINPESWIAPDNSTYGNKLPPIDLNNLFEYAVPKLEGDYDIYLSRHWENPSVYSCCIQNINKQPRFKPIFVSDKDPALALFRAIQEVMKNDK